MLSIFWTDCINNPPGGQVIETIPVISITKDFFYVWICISVCDDAKQIRRPISGLIRNQFSSIDILVNREHTFSI